MIKKKQNEEEIVKKYLYIIKGAARKFYNEYQVKRTILDIDDLIQEGCITLLRNARKGRNINPAFVNLIVFNSFVDSLRHEIRRVKDRPFFFSLDRLLDFVRFGEENFSNERKRFFLRNYLRYIDLKDAVPDKLSQTDMDRIENRLTLEKAMNLVRQRKSFTDKEKAAFRLRYLEGWTYRMIANHFKMSENSMNYWFEKKMIPYVLKILRA